VLWNRNLQLPVVDGKLIRRWQGAGFT